MNLEVTLRSFSNLHIHFNIHSRGVRGLCKFRLPKPLSISQTMMTLGTQFSFRTPIPNTGVGQNNGNPTDTVNIALKHLLPPIFPQLFLELTLYKFRTVSSGILYHSSRRTSSNCFCRCWRWESVPQSSFLNWPQWFSDDFNNKK
jgi:hypothetical protein